MVAEETGNLSLHVPSHVVAVHRHVKGSVIVLIRNMEEQIVTVMLKRQCRAILKFVLVGINTVYSLFVLFMI